MSSNYHTQKIRFTEFGVALGTAFPVMAIAIDLVRLDLNFSVASLSYVFGNAPIQWIILSAPIILGSVFYYFGKQFEKREIKHLEDKRHNDTELSKIESFLADIQQGNFAATNLDFDNENFNQFLKSIKETLQHQKEEDERRTWTAEGLNRFDEIFRNRHDLSRIADEVVSGIVKYSGLNQGSLFLVTRDDDGLPALELKACYAYNRKKHIEKTIGAGEGLVGQCFLENQTIVLTEVPKDYIKITSGLGEATAGFIVIVPIRHDDKPQGVLELASFAPLPEYRIRFIERVCESFASVILSVKMNEETTRLLESTQLQTEQLRAQEEEMRQNMEELHATQEAMERKTSEAEQQNTMLTATLDALPYGVITIDHNSRITSGNRTAAALLGHVSEDLQGLPVSSFIPDYSEHSASGGDDASVSQTRLINVNRRETSIDYSVHRIPTGGKNLSCIVIKPTKRSAPNAVSSS
jgi:PAS domain S-box-containing protein